MRIRNIIDVTPNPNAIDAIRYGVLFCLYSSPNKLNFFHS